MSGRRFPMCLSNPCHNQGTCMQGRFGRYRCMCQGTGYYGPHCQLGRDQFLTLQRLQHSFTTDNCKLKHLHDFCKHNLAVGGKLRSWWGEVSIFLLSLSLLLPSSVPTPAQLDWVSFILTLMPISCTTNSISCTTDSISCTTRKR